MMNVESYNEILEILLDNVTSEDCGHACYVSNEEDITKFLSVVNMCTDATPELINFNNANSNEYVFEFDYDVEIGLSYSIWPAADEDGTYFSNYGLCLVDKSISEDFEDDYNTELSIHDEDYIHPIRIKIGEDEKETPKKETGISSSESTRIDTNDDGTISGFTKKWENDHSFFTYTYHSTNEDDVLDVMERFGIKQ